LIGQRVNASLQKALDVAISRFEAGDITGIVVSNNIFFCFFIILLSWYVNSNCCYLYDQMILAIICV